MTLDPETIAAILAILIPMIQECLANRKTEEEIVAMLTQPSRRQRFVLLVALRREQRKRLRACWKQDDSRLDEELAVELVAMAKEEAYQINEPA